MPKLNDNYKKLNALVVDFHNQMLFLRLVNSGTVYKMSDRIWYTQQAFDRAFVILEQALNTKDVNLFNRIYRETKELVPALNAAPEIENIQNDFYAKTNNFVQQMARYMALKNRVR